jgi:hypothetical protein
MDIPGKLNGPVIEEREDVLNHGPISIRIGSEAIAPC